MGKDNSKNLAGSGEMEKGDIGGKSARQKSPGGERFRDKKTRILSRRMNRQIVLTVILGPNASATKLSPPADIVEMCSLRVWWTAAKATGSPDLLRAMLADVAASAALAPRQQ